MPTYEYECSKCGQRFDAFQNMSDEPLKHCPDCGGSVHRLIGTGGSIIFKGKGFYETDYKRSSTGTPRCGKDTPCCGRDVVCNSPPCNPRLRTCASWNRPPTTGPDTPR